MWSTAVTTMVLAVAAIVSATVAVCFHVIGSGDWLAIVGAFGGGTGLLHVAGGAVKSSGVASGG